MSIQCWGFNVPFSNVSAISVQPPVFFVLSMIKSMGVRTIGPDQLQQQGGIEPWPLDNRFNALLTAYSEV